MGVRSKGNRWEVDVAYSQALPAYRRIRRTVSTIEAARRLDAEILEALKVFGKWPLARSDKPIPLSSKKRQNVAKRGPAGGTLRRAAELAMGYRYKDTSYGEVVPHMLWPMVAWFEQRDCLDLDQIKSVDLEALVDWRREAGNTGSTINKYLSLVSVMSTIGLERDPPLCSKRIMPKRQKTLRVEKWWLRPEKLEEVTKWLEFNGEPIYADFIRTICYQGFRPEEALRLEERHFIGLHTKDPSVQVPGTKTTKSGNAIPVFEPWVPVVRRSIERAGQNGWSRLFPFTQKRARELWNECRENLGVSHMASATQRALRRTFGAYATARGMPTTMLQEIYRHTSITTTEGYLDLMNNGRLDQARDFMRDPKRLTRKFEISAEKVLHICILALRDTGAAPEEVATFAKAFLVRSNVDVA